MSGIAVGAVGLLVGVIIIGGILIWIAQPDGDAGGREQIPAPTGSSTLAVPGLPSPVASLPVTGVDRRPPAGPPGECDPGEPCLRISVNGPGSVSYVLRDNVTERSCPPTCEASFPPDAFVRLYRTRDLSPQQENGARMTTWGGGCSRLVAESEPRGGVCELTMDRDHQVDVAFEIRPRLEVQMPGSAPGWFDLAYEPEQVFAPAPSGHRLGCGQPPCRLEYFYDLGTEVTIDTGFISRGLAQTAATLDWGGACVGTGGWDRQDLARSDEGEPCSVVLSGDTTVVLEFGPFE